LLSLGELMTAIAANAPLRDPPVAPNREAAGEREEVRDQVNLTGAKPPI